MRNPVLTLGGLFATLGLSTVVLADGAGPGPGAPQPRSIVFTTPFEGGEFTYLDLGPEGIGPGDMFLVADLPVRVKGKRIGAMDGVETIISGAHDGIVSQQLALRLEGGNVMVGGIGRHDDTPFRLAVVGGTGKYSAARGQLVLVGDDAEAKENTFRLELRS